MLISIKLEAVARALLATMYDLTPRSQHVVQFHECDPFGHLNNARYLDMVLSAREDHLLHAYGFSLAEQGRRGIGWFVQEHQICYLRPAALRETLTIETRLLDYDTQALWMEGLVLDVGTTHLKAVLWSRFRVIDLTTKRPGTHAEEFLALVAQLRYPDPAPDTRTDLRTRAEWLRQHLPAAAPAA